METLGYVRVELERNAQDTRYESWKIKGSKGEGEQLADRVEKIGELRKNERHSLIGNLTDPCIHTINTTKRSLGIIKPIKVEPYFSKNPRHGEIFQMGLPGLTDLDKQRGKRDFPYEPRMKYTCPECQTVKKQHDQQVLEWGVCVWCGKHPDKKDQVWTNVSIGKPNRDIYFLVGNQSKYRNSFMVISILHFDAGEITKSMFPLKKVTQRDDI